LSDRPEHGELPTRRDRGLRAAAVRSAFWLWASAALASAATLMAAHSYALPRPATDNLALQRSVAATRAPSARGRWRTLHVLYSACRCSQRVLTHLSARGALPDVDERLVLVGAHAGYEQAARDAGFAVEVLAPAQLPTRYGLSAAPAFVVADPHDQLRYVGGYTERKQGLALRDLALLAALRAGRASPELPLFGCAVSRSLQALLDPLGLMTKGLEGND
jgi:hypothetical protein